MSEQGVTGVTAFREVGGYLTAGGGLPCVLRFQERFRA